MAWQKLGSTKLTTAADTITVDGFTAKKHLMIQIHTLGVGAINNRLRFNNDSGNNYAYRISGNGGSDSTTTSHAGIPFGNGNTQDPDNAFDNIYVINEQTKEKLVIGHTITDEGTGAGNAPQRNEVVAKWANTSNAITRVDLVNTSSGDFAADSEITVYGTDSDSVGGDPVPSCNLQTNSIWEESDTGKHYIWTGSAWTEVA